MKLLKGGVRIPIEFDMRDETDELFHVKFNVTFVRFTASLKNKRAKESKKISKAIQRELKRIEKEDRTEDELSDEESAALEKLLADLAGLPIKWMKSDIIRWDGLRDMDDTEVKFSKTELNDLLEHTPFIDGFHQGWSDAHGGVRPEAEIEADTKNS